MWLASNESCDGGTIRVASDFDKGFNTGGSMGFLESVVKTADFLEGCIVRVLEGGFVIPSVELEGFLTGVISRASEGNLAAEVVSIESWNDSDEDYLSFVGASFAFGLTSEEGLAKDMDKILVCTGEDSNAVSDVASDEDFNTESDGASDEDFVGQLLISVSLSPPCICRLSIFPQSRIDELGFF